VSIEPVEYYRAVCDACGEDITGAGGEYTAWSDRTGAIEDASYSDALVIGDLVVCDSCICQHRVKLDEEAWDALADQTPEAIARLQAWADAALAAAALNQPGPAEPADETSSKGRR
jgi:hypothetical protein